MRRRLLLIGGVALLLAARPGSRDEGCNCASERQAGFTTIAASSGAGGAGGAGGSSEDDDNSCTNKPEAGLFDPVEECSFSGPPSGDPYPAWDDVVMTPVVVNLTDDNGDMTVDLSDIPDIAFVTYRLQEDGCCNQNGVLRVASGRCQSNGQMELHYSIGAAEIEKDSGEKDVWLDNSGGIAVGDIDADGSVDLVATINGGGTIAFERDGRVKWVQRDHPKSGEEHYAGTAPSLADLDADGKPEVIQGRVVLNGADGTLKWKGEGSIGTNGFMGPVSVVSDPDLDGQLNVLAGNTMYAADGSIVWTYEFSDKSNQDLCQGGDNWPCTGFTAVGNFDADPQGEIVIVRMGAVYILEHDGTLLNKGGLDAKITMPDSGCQKNEGGPPTVADFDGDGESEVGVAGADYYIVVDLECLVDPVPSQCDSLGIRWKVANKDCSSRVTGSSVFDFDGDGEAEVVYNDEKQFRVLSGTTGKELLSIDNRSHTRLEMPIVADVDGDGNAEIIFIENGQGAKGIQIWGSKTNSWVATRRIWNQHSYHVTNVGELGEIPQVEPVNWLTPTSSTIVGLMNNFRQNLPDYDVFQAPDLIVKLSASGTCPVLDLKAEICNIGALVIGFGVPVDFFDNETEMAISCKGGAAKTQFPINPKKCEDVICVWDGAPKKPKTVDLRVCVDNGSYPCTGDGAHVECHEDNNTDNYQGDGCSEAPK
jgi:hypothetical protein